MKKQRWEESEKRREEASRSEKRKSQKKEDAGANHCVFPMIYVPEGRKVGSLKRRVRSHLARWETNNCTLLWREARVEVKMYKAHHSQSTFGSRHVEKVYAVVSRSTFGSQTYKTHHSHSTFGNRHVEKLHAVVARSTCPSQNVKNTSASEHF